MAFPPRFLDELRGRLSIAEIVGRRVKLTRRGREYIGLCPFHKEKTPSFAAVEDKGFYHCFGCGAHGDVIGFVMQTENLSFPEAVEQLARQAGLEVPKETPEERERQSRQATLQGAIEAAGAFFERMLQGAEGRRARDYLSGRGLDEATIARFHLGYAPEGRDHLKRALAKNFPEALLVEAGLLRRPEGGGESYDYFRDRVMFPIGDRRGRMIAFGGRVMGDGQPKYLNSPETPLFQKGRVLYGWALARTAAAKEPSVIAVEGYMDVIALHRAGFATAVAPLGTALTEQQMEEMWKLAPEPILCFDGDAAGQRAAGRALARALPLLKPGMSLRFATVPSGEDPDSLIRHHGADAMRGVLDRASPLAEVLWRLETAKPVDTPERRAALEQRLEQQVRAIADRSVQEHYRRFFRDKVAELLGARRGGNSRPFRPGARPGWRPGGWAGSARRNGAVPPDPPPTRDPNLLLRRREEVLLALILNHPFLLNEMAEDLAKFDLNAPDLDKLSRAIQEAHQALPELEESVLKRHLMDNGFAAIMERVLSPEVLEHARFAKLDADAETARSGWAHMMVQFQRQRSAHEIRAAVADLASDLTPENWGRVEQLQRTELESKDQDEGAV